MAFPIGPPVESSGPGGETYAAVLVRADGGEAEVTRALRDLRATGWVAPPDAGWIAFVAAPGDGVVAAGRRDVLALAGELAARLDVAVLSVRVRHDRQLVLAAWRGEDELGRYSSDPSREPGADEEVLAEPVGVEHAAAVASLAGHPGAEEVLARILGEELESESVFESERLREVLELLTLPSWLVAVAALPDDVPTGPRARSFTRLGAGRAGAAGVVAGRLARVARRRMSVQPAVADPPRADDLGEIDPWLL
ncbi:hypothetical protein [Agromyces sp. SYSU T0242]|uniref:hypothetical protein n=1 Tax=Agromyces litoreus TaxID=3158561 RepID=UPI003392096C